MPEAGIWLLVVFSACGRLYTDMNFRVDFDSPLSLWLRASLERVHCSWYHHLIELARLVGPRTAPGCTQLQLTALKKVLTARQ